MIRAMLFVAVCLSVPQPARAADEPNVVVIFADDLGYGDVGCYGAKHVHADRTGSDQKPCDCAAR